MSTAERPKQFIDVLGVGRSLLQLTYERFRSICNPENVWVVTNRRYADIVCEQLPEVPRENILLEPCRRNTAPCIAYVSWRIKTLDPKANVVVTPSDHIVTNEEEFRRVIVSCMSFTSQTDAIVTLGMKPNRPETGYGYIKTEKPLETGYKVEKFVEKPDLKTAEKYLESGEYYWNGGIFMGKISSFLSEIEKYAKDIYTNLSDLDFRHETTIPYMLYDKMPSISIDYAVMEKSDKIALVELLSDWNDLGSWQSIYSIKEKDDNGNVLTGKVVVDNVKNSLIYSQKEIVAVSGLENIILVETEDAIMACKMDESQNVKKLYEKLKEEESDTTKLHKTVFRPWGYYTCMNSGKGYLTKTICVLPKQKLSVQSHKHRSEHWVVLEGKALVLKDGREYNIDAGGSIDIPVGIIHSLQNPYDSDLKIIEVQKGDYLAEDDIIRYEDCYGRV